MSFLARGLSNLIGIVAPVIGSFKVLKKPTKPRLIECMHYWTIYGSFLIVDWFLSTFYVSCFIPFYDFFILTFTVLMAIPHIGFASVLYTKFLAPFLRKYERRIDNISAKLMDKVWENMPIVASAVPAVLASVVATLNSAPTPISQLEIEEIDSSMSLDPEPRRRPAPATRTPSRSEPIFLDQSFEIQDDEDLNLGGDDVFIRQIKQEIVEEDLEIENPADATPPSPPRRRSTMQTRRQLRSVQQQQFRHGSVQ